MSKQMFKKIFKKGQQQNMVNFFIGILVVVIISVGAVLPTVQDVITNSTITGTAKTLLLLVPLLLVVVVIIAIVGGITQR